MFFDSRVFVAASLLQSFAAVNGGDPQEMILEGPTMLEGCAADRCAMWDQSSAFDEPYTGTVTFPFDDDKFEDLEWTTKLDKAALCQVCLGPPTGTVQDNENKYVLDDLKCRGVNTGDYDADGDEMVILAYEYWKYGGSTSSGYKTWGDGPVYNYLNMPTYKLVEKLYWSEDPTGVPEQGNEDQYYCVKMFDNFLDPCCVESLAPSVKPTPPPTSISMAPTTTSDDNPCFSDSATVEVQGKGKVTMKSLQVGDVVLTPSGYEKVYTIDHRSEKKQTDFIQIHTEIERPLEVTGTHLMFKAGKNDPVEARSIVVGDELQGYFDGEMKSVVVEQITSISKNGLYNPITSSGTIVVDGLVTSTYTAVNLSDGSNYITIGGYKVMSMHDFMHMAMIPFKTICMSLSDASFCTVSDGNEHNIYDQFGLTLMKFGKSQNVLVQNGIMFSLISFLVVVITFTKPTVLISLVLFKSMKKQTKN
jgi:hypothetical protein